jgi:ABC-type spermidine/putrescine transport system permease subunit II
MTAKGFFRYGLGALALLALAFGLVLLPNLLPAVLSGSLVAFAISMGEFEVTSMVAGFGTVTLPLLLFQSLREDLRAASAVASVLLYTPLLALAGLTLLKRR